MRATFMRKAISWPTPFRSNPAMLSTIVVFRFVGSSGSQERFRDGEAERLNSHRGMLSPFLINRRDLGANLPVAPWGVFR
jgi:hypothetical protein